jgi:NADH-quinone oxidoreductase subunit M
VEAPTIGSVLLAGILLKLGTYGMIRILLILFPDATIFFKPLVYVLSLCGIIFISGVAILQTDLKKIIAYASIVHMSYILLGLFSLDASAVSASVFLMLSHGLVSAALFFLVGELYGRYKIRTIKYFRGLSLYMPTFSSLFFICILANVSFPGTSNFIGEFLILLNIFKFSAISCFISTLLIILGTVYSI